MTEVLHRSDPGRTLLLHGDRTWTYGLADRNSDAAAALLQQGGVTRGDRVALLLDNSPDYVWLLLGLAKLGAIGVTLNTEARGKLLEYLVADCGARHAVVDARHRDTLDAAYPGGADAHFDRLWVREGPGFVEEIAAGSFSVTFDGEPRALDPWLFIYTSGTTGRSKAVVALHGHAVTTCVLVERQAGGTAEDRMYTCRPFFHAYGLWYTLLAAMSVGASVVVAERFSASRFWEEITRHGCTEVNAMGSMMQILEKLPVSDAGRAHTLRTAFVVPFPGDPQAFERRFRARLMTTYALSEWVPASLSRPGGGYGRGIHAGPVCGPSEVHIVDDDDRELPFGEVGKITLRSRDPWTTFLGYHGKPKGPSSSRRRQPARPSRSRRRCRSRVALAARSRETHRPAPTPESVGVPTSSSRSRSRSTRSTAAPS